MTPTGNYSVYYRGFFINVKYKICFSDAAKFMKKIYYPIDEGMNKDWLNERIRQYLGEKWVGKVSARHSLHFP